MKCTNIVIAVVAYLVLGTFVVAKQVPLQASKGISAGPLNDAGLVGEAVTLQCIASSNESWIAWVEYATGNPSGRPVSEGENVLEGHPYSERYQIIHDAPTHYHLHISDSVEGDGGLYMCRDIETGEEAYAELIMINGDPTCVSNVPETGAVMEGYVHTINCSVSYRGNVAPTMTWTGAGTYAIESTATNESVWTKVTFTATKIISATYFSCKTNFTESGFGDVNTATNVPTYEHNNEGRFLNVYCTCSGSPGQTTTLIQQSDGSDGAFNRPWDDLKNGFSIANNFWLGNAKVNILTQYGNCWAHFELWSTTGEYYYANYSKFLVGDETTFYQMTVEGYSGTASDGISKYNGHMFSTHDRDNDNSAGNCAEAFNGGWWFDQCLYQALITLPKSEGRFGWDMLPGSYHISFSKVWVICN